MVYFVDVDMVDEGGESESVGVLLQQWSLT